MNRNTNLKKNRIFQILYPLLVYFILYQFSAKIFLAIVPLSLGRLFALFMAAWVTYPFILAIYRKVPIVRSPRLFSRDDLKTDLSLILLIVIVGVMANVIISHTPLVDISEAYKHANKELYDGAIWVKLITNCMMIPVLEETLFRGIIAAQIDLWYGRVASIILSSLLFGMFHFNLVQLIYACLIGAFLSYAMSKTHKLWVCIASHGILNLIVVIVSVI